MNESARSQASRNSKTGTPPIKTIRVLSSGTAEQHREHRYGTKKPLMWWVLTSRSWVKLPINFFLIEHCDGPILFDTGLDPAIISDTRGYIPSPIGRFLLSRVFKLHMKPDASLDRVLTDQGIDVAAVSKAVISHLHFDHVGGISHIPQADLLVSKKEWDQLSKPHPEREWFLKEHIEIPGAKWHPITFEPSTDPLFEDFDGIFDVANDGSMILLPTPGHTKGSLSMLIRRKGWRPILLVADLTYETSLLENDVTPGIGDKAGLLKSFAKVRRLREKLPGLTIIASHDFGAEQALAAAM